MLNPVRRKRLLLILLAAAFLFRLGFGLCSEFWLEDEKQTFLIGLKFYATGEWPYFGPDVDYPRAAQQPGALQGLVVGLPLFALPAPEAPFLLLNLLSFSSLCLFAWYCSKHLPETPRWFIWTWLLTAPWTLHFSTHVVNLSYLLPAGVLFFVALWETFPSFTRGVVPPKWAYFMMGLSLLWVMQFHMSWTILPPFVLASFYARYRASRRGVISALLWFALGAFVGGAFLLPTFYRYGLRGGLGGTDTTVGFNVANLLNAYNIPEGILGRFLSFASYELPRFLGSHTAQRLALFRQQPWLIPFGVILLVVGLLQPAAMLFLWFPRKHAEAGWKFVRRFTLASVCLLYLIFLFAEGKPPSAHTFYVMLPAATLYGFYCWDRLLRRRAWRRFAAAFLACGVVFQAALAAHNFQVKSLYLNRGAVQSAISAKDYHLLGERRPGTRF